MLGVFPTIPRNNTLRARAGAVPAAPAAAAAAGPRCRRRRRRRARFFVRSPVLLTSELSSDELSSLLLAAFWSTFCAGVRRVV